MTLLKESNILNTLELNMCLYLTGANSSQKQFYAATVQNNSVKGHFEFSYTIVYDNIFFVLTINHFFIVFPPCNLLAVGSDSKAISMAFVILWNKFIFIVSPEVKLENNLDKTLHLTK